MGVDAAFAVVHSVPMTNSTTKTEAEKTEELRELFKIKLTIAIGINGIESSLKLVHHALWNTKFNSLVIGLFLGDGSSIGKFTCSPGFKFILTMWWSFWLFSFDLVSDLDKLLVNWGVLLRKLDGRESGDKCNVGNELHLFQC